MARRFSAALVAASASSHLEATFHKASKEPPEAGPLSDPSGLLEHICDCGLNRCGAAHRRTSRSPGPSSRCFSRTTTAGEPAVLNRFYGAMELALDLLDLTTSTFQSAADQSLRLFLLTCVSHFSVTPYRGCAHMRC